MKNRRMIMGIMLIGALAWLTGSAHPAYAESQETLTIAAAHSLKGVLRSILPVFEAEHPNIAVRVVYGPSKRLRQYIEDGAPVDLFLPSSMEEIEQLEKKGLIFPRTTRVYAQMPIVLITGAAVPAPVAVIQDLRKPEVRRIAVGNPETSSAGKFAIQVFKYARLDPEIRSRYVYGEHSEAVLNLVASGEAEVGAVYRADAVHSPKVRIITEAPAESHVPARYGLGTVWTAKNVALVREFEQFILAPQAQTVLQKHGFDVVKDGVVAAHNLNEAR